MALYSSTDTRTLDDAEHYCSDTLLERADSNELVEFMGEKAPALSKTGEEPKVALRKNNLFAALRCLIHVPSVAITLGVLALTFRKVFWQAPGPNTNSVLGALQFAAKVHESLIVVSLCTMVLYHIRNGLVGSRGVPLGLLSSGFQLNSVAYMFSPEFWSGATSSTQQAVERMPMVLGILAAFALANLAAPSSAITMIPRLDWWPLGELWPGNRITFSAYVHAANDTLFPETVTPRFLPDYCLGDNATWRSDCPSGGLRTLMSNAQFLSSLPTQWLEGLLPPTNITMPLLNNQAMRFLGGLSSPVNRGNNSLFAASSISDFMASAILDYYSTVSEWRLPGTNDLSPLYEAQRPLLQASLETGGQVVIPHKPAVQVECGAMPFGVSDVVFPHDLFMTTPWTENAFLNAQWSIPISAISDIALNDESGKVNFTWVDFGGHRGPKPSLAGVFTLPSFNSEAGIDNAIYACTVGANWIPTEPWIDPATDLFIHEALPQPFTNIVYDTTGPGGTIPTYSPLYIDLAWADSLNVKYSSNVANQTALEALASACISSTGSGANTTLQSALMNGMGNGMAMSQCLEMGLALYIADGLSRMQSAIPTYFVATGPGLASDISAGVAVQDLNPQSLTYTNLITNITLADLQNPADYTEFHFEVLRYGYGYGFRGILIYVAVVVLLIHIVLVLAHMGFVLAGGSSSNVWSSIGEMMVLMINSSRTEQLHNTCAGVSKKGTWGLVAKVRQTSDTHLELVFEENEKECGQLLEQVQPEKKYG